MGRFISFIFILLSALIVGAAGAWAMLTIVPNTPLGPILLGSANGSGSGVVQTVQKVKEESATIDVVEEAKPSVVNIVVTQELQKNKRSPFSGGTFFNDPFFDQFFDVPSSDAQTETETVEVAEGSGFVISEDGLILTNRHVVNIEDAGYTIIFDDGTSYTAEVLARDTFTDLAILKIDAKNLEPLPLGDSDALQAGQTVITIGTTLGEYTNTVTKGIVSGLRRTPSGLGAEYAGLIQTDAAISQGNSGGPLLNLSGEVVGINTLVDRGGEGIGFAIPINEAKIAIDSVKEHGRIIRPALGIRYVEINKEIAEANNLLYDYGAYIRGTDQLLGVIPGSAADNAGLKEGYIILEVDGVRIDEEHSLPSLIREHVVGDVITLNVFKDSEEQDVEVTLSELPQEQEKAETEQQEQEE